MKRSTNVPASFVAVVAASLVAGCSSSSSGPAQIRRCVDSTGRVLPDEYCDRPGYRTGGISYIGAPHWGYGGSVNGNTLRNFSNTPPTNADVVTPSGRTISRGGFGGGGGFFGG